MLCSSLATYVLHTRAHRTHTPAFVYLLTAAALNMCPVHLVLVLLNSLHARHVPLHTHKTALCARSYMCAPQSLCMFYGAHREAHTSSYCMICGAFWVVPSFIDHDSTYSRQEEYNLILFDFSFGNLELMRIALCDSHWLSASEIFLMRSWCWAHQLKQKYFKARICLVKRVT